MPSDVHSAPAIAALRESDAIAADSRQLREDELISRLAELSRDVVAIADALRVLREGPAG